MENLELYLSILASVLGIFATIVSLINRNEIKEMKSVNSNNYVKGRNNNQISGNRNKIEVSDRD